MMTCLLILRGCLIEVICLLLVMTSLLVVRLIDPEDSTSDFDSVKSKKRKVVKDLDDAVPLPSPYPLPSHYSSEVEAALKQGRLCHVTRQAFLSSVSSLCLATRDIQHTRITLSLLTL